MEYFVGAVLAIAVAALAAAVGLDHGRVFYPTVLIVVATYYVLFAVMGASFRVLLIEIAIAIAFLLLAIVGFKKTLWLVATALIGHGVFDALHGFVVENPGVPQWWPGFCLAFDGVAGVWLALRILTRSLKPNDSVRAALPR